MQSYGFPETGGVFENTPVSLTLLSSFGLFRAIAFLPKNVDVLEYNTAAVLHAGQPWRILSAKFCFLETRDLLTCVVLMFHLRAVERRLGSSRFVSLMLGLLVLTCAVEFSVLHLLDSYLPSFLPLVVPSGPFFMVYPLFQWFVAEFPPVSRSSSPSTADAPVVTPFLLLTIAGVGLLFTPPPAYLPIGCALLAGALHKDNFLCIRSLLNLPRGLFSKRPCNVSTRKIGATVEIQRSMHSEFIEQQVIYNSSIFRNTRNAVPPPEELVTQLTEMGFDRNNAIQALQTTNNNLQMATNILLNQ